MMSGELAEKSSFFSIWPGEQRVFRPFRWISRIPEEKLVQRAAGVFTRIDPLMSRQHARRVRQVLGEQYAAISASEPEFLAFEGASDLALNHLCGLPHETGHYYAYIPKHHGDRPLGAMVFLHGNAGNLKIFCHRWRNLAENLGLAVLAPSNGFGFWGRNSAGVVSRALADLTARWPQIDQSKGLWLVGLSDGGNGVTRSALTQPWHGLVYVSATMRAKELGQKEFREGWKNRPLLVLHGRADHNVSPRMAEKSIEVLRQGGAEVSAEWYDKEDHFLTFGAADAVDERIARWIRTSRTEPDRSSAAAFA